MSAPVPMLAGQRPPHDGLPPHDVAAEEAVIAALMLDVDAYARVLSIVQPEDFFREQNGWVYEACLALAKRDEAVTIPSVAHELDRGGRLDSSGGLQYLSDIAAKYFTSVGVEAHARIVARDSRYRRLIQAAGQIAQMAYEGGPDVQGVIQSGLSSLGALLVSADSGVSRLGGIVEADATGPEWGIPVLDRLTMGMVGGRLSLIAAPSGMGKSMLAAHIVRRVAENCGRVVVFTMEMSNGEYQERLAHAVSGVAKRYTKSAPPLTDNEKERLHAARQSISQWDVLSYDRPVGIERLSATVRTLSAKKPVDLVVVDYLHLMDMSDRRETSAQNLKNITKGLKQLAADLGCHVLLLSQMNRASLGEMRGKDGQKLTCIATGKKYPQPFKEGLMGGAVENDADLVIQLQRHVDCEMNHIEVCVTKNRHGIEGHGMMIEDFATCRVMPMAEPEISSIARGDMTIWRALMRDQGLLDS